MAEFELDNKGKVVLHDNLCSICGTEISCGKYHSCGGTTVTWRYCEPCGSWVSIPHKHCRTCGEVISKCPECGQ